MLAGWCLLVGWLVFVCLLVVCFLEGDVYMLVGCLSLKSYRWQFQNWGIKDQISLFFFQRKFRAIRTENSFPISN